MFCVLRSVYVLCSTFCFVFCVVFMFCDLRLVFVLCLFYVHSHQLFVVISNNAANNGDTDTPGKHKICKNRFVRTHKLPIAPCPMPFNVSFDEIILNLAPPFFLIHIFVFSVISTNTKTVTTQTQEQTHNTNTQHKHTAQSHSQTQTHIRVRV